MIYFERECVATLNRASSRRNRSSYKISLCCCGLLKGLFAGISQKISNSDLRIATIAEHNLHKVLLGLLAARDMVVIQATLQLLSVISEHSEEVRSELSRTNALDSTLQLLKESDILSQKLAASLLRILCSEMEAREQIKVYDGVAILTGLLSTKNVRLQWHVAWTLAQLAEDEEVAAEIGQLGAISIMLAEISDFNGDFKAKALDDWLTMLTGLMGVMAQACHIDSNTQLIVQDNGIFRLCKILTAQIQFPEWNKNRNYIILQCSIFRVLRLIFSVERNRALFRNLFPSDLYSAFIDVGHYNLDLTAYEPLVTQLARLLENDQDEITKGLDSVNQRRAPISYIGPYAILEQLGAGAFGCVYRVCKKSGSASASLTSSSMQTEGQFFALKEIFMHQTGGGSMADKSGEKSFGDIISEVKIIKHSLRHPNVVRYRRVFVENDKLYIVMDLIDGVSLKDHIISFKEKNTKFPEERIWNLLIQMVLALRYLHKEKGIIHRDLKPNNVMLTENDRVVITDFGLAKSLGESYLKSTAGTILYSCPEIVQSTPYGQKADIWSLGCVLYEMCMLDPPFFSNNMLQLASSIVTANYKPIPKEMYTSAVINTVSKCLTPKSENRPDVVGVGQLISDKLLAYIDGISHQHQIERRQLASNSNQRFGNDFLNSSNQSMGGYSTISMGSRPGSRQTNSLSDQSDRGPMGASLPEPLGFPRRGTAKMLDNLAGIAEGGRPRIRGRSRTDSSSEGPRGVKSATAGSRIPRAQSQSTKRVLKRSLSTSNLPVIDLTQSKSTNQRHSAKNDRKQAWHDDPLVLPTIRRANSTSLVDSGRGDAIRVNSAGTQNKVTISSSKLKEVSDPILELLSVLHRVVLLSSVHSETINHKRRVLDHFKKEIFSPESNPVRIKAELRKLSAQSGDVVPLNLGYTDYRCVLEGIPFETTSPNQKLPCLTYEQLYAVIEALMAEEKANGGLQPHDHHSSRLSTAAPIVSPRV